MAQSPAHRFGQIIGEVLERAVEPLLQEFALQYGLYLDKKGPRSARKGNKVTWYDLYGNAHDLDFVLEKGGTQEKRGLPIAFIETAWRRYTKHSRNKAQEIQGAVIPLVNTYKNINPFFGVILAGAFTEGALEQLRSLGFVIVYFPYEGVMHAFKSVGIDAHFDEETPDDLVAAKVERWEALSTSQRDSVSQLLVEMHRSQLLSFIEAMSKSVTRKIQEVIVLALHGLPVSFLSVEQAVNAINEYNENNHLYKNFVRYEIEIVYFNNDRIKASFSEKDRAVEFLQSFI